MQKWVLTLLNVGRKTWRDLGCQPSSIQPFRSARRGRRRDGSPDEGAEGGGAQAHVALDAQEADEKRSNALHQPQVVELLGVLGVDLLEAQRGQGAFLRGLGLRGDLLPVLKAARPRLGTSGTHTHLEWTHGASVLAARLRLIDAQHDFFTKAAPQSSFTRLAVEVQDLYEGGTVAAWRMKVVFSLTDWLTSLIGCFFYTKLLLGFLELN